MNPCSPRPPKQFHPEPFAYHEEVILEISSLSHLGAGVGRRDGWVVMVPFALPGERIRARVWRNHSSFSDADLVEVIQPSPHRIEPRCTLFGRCGGCQYQHLSYEEQLKWKTRHVRESFARIAGSGRTVNPAHPSPCTYGYRSKLTPHFQRPREDREVPIGFLRTGSRRLIDVPQCPIASPGVNRALEGVRSAVRERRKAYKRGATLLLREGNEDVATDADEVISETVGGLVFQFQAGEFFQVNRTILPAFVGHVVAELRGRSIDYLIDSYCGVGVFCLSASPFFKQVAGVEVSPAAIRWANANAVVNRIENAEFFLGVAETLFAQIDFPGKATCVVVDPPRKGCDTRFLQQLLDFGPARVIYVSCHPATQARDIKILIEKGYAITKVQPFDLFPQTRHIENVVTLTAARS